MTRIKLIAVAVGLVIIDLFLSDWLSIGQVKPSLTLPFVVYVGLHCGAIQGSLYGLCVGIGVDLAGAMPLGTTAFIYTVIGFFSGKLWDGGLFRLVWPWSVFLIVSAMLAAAVSHYVLSRDIGLDFAYLFLRYGVPGAVYTTAVGILWFLSPLHRPDTV